MAHLNFVDHSGGRAFIHDGTIFYSPNSTRPVAVPTRDNRYYRFEKQNAYLDRFQAPEWWTTAYGFLSFVNLVPSFNGAAFSCLREFVSAIQEISHDTHTEYAMAFGKAGDWVNLETTLIQIVSLLRKKFLVGAALNPIPPSLLGFRKAFRTRRSALLRAAASRNWFVIWMALLSFFIAQIEYLEHSHEIPDWFQYLVDAGISQTWLSGFHQSGLCNFSKTSLRTGVFIDWLEKDNSRPRLEFFTLFNVPVWYPWTTQLEELIAKKPDLGNLRPPPERLQSAATFIMKRPQTFAELFGVSDLSAFRHESDSHSPAQLSPSQYPSQSQHPVLDSPASPIPAPSSPQPSARDMSYTELLAARLAHVKTKPWSPFFQAREARNAEKASTETAQARQVRLNRERKPPQKKVEVYVWDWSDEDPLQLVRSRVTTNRERQDALESHSSSQSIYDSWSNQWDLCEYFGKSDDDDDDDDDDEGFGYQDGFGGDDDPGDNEAAHAAYIDSRIQGPLPRYEPVQDDIPSAAPNPTSFDILDYLSMHYGFVCPLSQPSSNLVDKTAWDNCMKALGRVAGPTNPPLSDFYEPITRFVTALQSAHGPQRDDFDAFPDNRVTVNSRRFSDTIVYLGGFFVVQPHAFRSCSWTIAVYDLPQALFVLRLLHKGIHTPTSLAHILLEEGVAFRTVLPLADVHVKLSLDDIVTMVPIRLSDYVFKPSDYEIYVNQRAMILSSPRGRAALLRGGIISRLAKEHLDIDSACLGPSSSVTIHRIGFSITDSDGAKHWDDELTEDEINVICGLHRCYTGNGAQQALVSWWPLPVQWDNIRSNGHNWGYWTEWDELWYSQRLEKIRQGDPLGVPFTASGWRTKLKGAASARLVTQGIRTHLQKLFKQ